MQATLTGIRQTFSDMRHNWDKARLKKSHVFWIAIGAVILTLFLGFSRGGWTTETSANNMAATSAQDAVVERLASICVAQYGADPQQASKLEELQGLSAFKRTSFVKDQGWATMPGETAPDNRVATECGNRLSRLGK